jgi:hypothetical protein
MLDIATLEGKVANLAGNAGIDQKASEFVEARSEYVLVLKRVCAMYLGVYVCMYACMYVCFGAETGMCYVCTYVYVYVCMRWCSNVSSAMYVRLCVCLHVLVLNRVRPMYVCICVYMYIRVDAKPGRAYVCVYICMCVYVYICICMCWC